MSVASLHTYSTINNNYCEYLNLKRINIGSAAIKHRLITADSEPLVPQVTSSAGPKEDRRLKRLASVAHGSEEDLVAKRRRHADVDEDEPEPVRRPVRAEIVEPAPREEVASAAQDSESDSDAEARRARIRARVAAEDEELLPVQEDDEEEDDEEEEESEDEESDEQFFVPHRAAAIRPHFVKR